MVEIMGGILKSIFVYPEIATTIIAMFPIIELKGAMPLGMSVEFWGSDVLSGNAAFIYSILGSSLVVPILALVFKPIIRWMKSTRIFKDVASKIEGKVGASTSKIEQKIDDNSRRVRNLIIKMLGVFAFVAVPLPLTGVWTGTCIGVALGLNFFQTVTSVILGNVVAALLIKFVCSVFESFTTVIFFIILVIVLMMVLVTLIKRLLNKRQKEKSDQF